MPPPNNVQRRLFLFSLAAFILAANEKEKNAANKWPNQMVEKSAAAKASAEKNEKSAIIFLFYFNGAYLFPFVRFLFGAVNK